MVFNRILNIFSDFLVQHLASNQLFKNMARFVNVNFSPKKDVMFKVNNHKMYASTLDRILALFLWKFSALEAFEKTVMKKIIKKGMVVFDVGANIGHYTLILANLTGKNGKVYAFEPDPENYRLLIRNIKVNKYNNVVPVQKAVLNKGGKIKFFISEEHRGNSTIYDLGKGSKVISVNSLTLDKFVKGKIVPDVVKIDVEGAEFLAIQGMDKIIKKNKDITIICEFFPDGLRKLGNSPQQFINKLKDYGFKIKFINEKEKRIEQISGSSLIKLCTGSKYTNLFLRR